MPNKASKKNQIILFFSLLIFFLMGLFSNVIFKFDFKNRSFSSPFVSNNAKEKPLQQYSINNLRNRKYIASPIVIEKILDENNNYTSYLFSYTSTGKSMTGQMNIPTIRAYGKTPGVILMIRGYIPTETYQTGMGTKNAAAAFAQAGYITVAPDFFGAGNSDQESEDSWEARFIKPVNVIELIASLRNSNYMISDELELTEKQSQSIAQLNKTTKQTSKNFQQDLSLGIWAHSNGGQIALSVLEITGKKIPTTLWAPMLAPFPYSILYFGWDEADEGKEQRKWISLFEEDYDVFDFSVTQHTDKLNAPIQIQHGGADDQVLTVWIESVVEKIKTSSEAQQSEDTRGEVNYINYPNADHNLQPNWKQAIQKDLQFFAENL